MFKRGWAGDARDLPWWGFFVVLGVVLAFTGIIVGAVAVLGDARMIVRAVVLVVVAGVGIVIRWMYRGLPGDSGEEPPEPN